jgi:hypothetical protein
MIKNKHNTYGAKRLSLPDYRLKSNRVEFIDETYKHKKGAMYNLQKF